jgi:hypothetical protein
MNLAGEPDSRRESGFNPMFQEEAAPMPTRRLIAAGALVAFLALGGCGKAISSADHSMADDMSLGNPNAKVKVIEYASASCPHCARFDLEVLPSTSTLARSATR